MDTSLIMHMSRCGYSERDSPGKVGEVFFLTTPELVQMAFTTQIGEFTKMNLQAP